MSSNGLFIYIITTILSDNVHLSYYIGSSQFKKISICKSFYFIFVSATSIHTSRGFGGYRPSQRMPASLRFLGPSIRIALPLAILWSLACSFQAALVVQTIITLSTISNSEVEENTTDLLVLASVELGLALMTLTAVFLVIRIDCTRDPD